MPKVFISPHNKIAIFFLVLTIILLIVFFSSINLFQQKLEITLKVIPEVFKTNFLLVVKQEGLDIEGDIEGKLLTIEKEASLNFKPQSSTEVKDYAQGKVLLYNDTSNNQRIIAASRLESPEGLIFRLKEAVLIPAQGTAQVEVKADKPGKEYELGPTTFTLPGLKNYPELYEKIYAKNENTFSGGTKTIYSVQEEDLDQAKNQLQETLNDLALEELNLNLPQAGYKLISQSNILDFTCQAEVGEEKEEFPCSGKIELQALALKEDDLLEEINTRVKASLPRGKKLVSISSSPLIEIKDFSPQEKSILEIEAQGETILTPDNPYLDKSEFINLKPQEIKEYLEKIESVKQVELKFSPFFIKKTPSQEKNIEINIIQYEEEK